MIPVFKPSIHEADVVAVSTAVRNGEISGTFGETIKKFEGEFSSYSDCKFGIAVSSGTAALHLAVAALGLEPNSEVLVSASTNIASALCVLHNQCITVPVDSERETWNIDLSLLEALLTPKTKAIIVVHLFGCPIDMPRLMSFARAHDLYVIEDCAEAHGATFRGQKVGSFGDLACYSFYANKIITTGEGGMVTTNNLELAEKCKLLRNLAFMTPRFYHEEAGFNFRMTGYQAALGRSQFTRIEALIEEKRDLARRYQNALSSLPWITHPIEPNLCRHVYWMYPIVINSVAGKNRDSFMTHLANHGIETRTFFCPMNLQPCLAKRQGLRATSCPVAEELWASGLYLPSGYSLSDNDFDFIIHKIKEF